jgi:hypothetical protein
VARPIATFLTFDHPDCREPVLPGETGNDVSSVLIDAHVHLHDCFEPATFLESAQRNFELAAGRQGWKPALGVLMFTESEDADWFGRLAERAHATAGATPAFGPWSIEVTPDPCALIARSGNRRLAIVAGRQVAAREGLEVLMLGTRERLRDGRPLPDLLADAVRFGALRVIPWGAGKWLFGRGRLMSDIIAAERPVGGFFLGDGAGRPFFWGTPSHFREAEARGIRILPGTDPLPFPRQMGRAGSYGFLLEGTIDLTRPAEGIKTALLDPSSRLTPFGKAERALPFIRNQIAMQRRKRQRPVATSSAGTGR